jgi:hypothetical protein
MKKIKNDPLHHQRVKSMDKANVVFLKLYAKRRGKYKGWSDVRAETLPITIETNPGANDV